MKITEILVHKLAEDIHGDLLKITEENAERLLRSLDEQMRSGGDNSIALSISVEIVDEGAFDNALKVRTRYGWVRKVKVADEFIEHVIDLGETLFDQAKRRTGKDAEAGQ